MRCLDIELIGLLTCILDIYKGANKMETNVFLDKIQDLLDCEQEITMDSVLADIEEWDSLSFVSFLAMANAQYGKKINPKELKKAKTIADLYNFIKK